MNYVESSAVEESGNEEPHLCTPRTYLNIHTLTPIHTCISIPLGAVVYEEKCLS